MLLCSAGFGVWAWLSGSEPAPAAETVRMVGTVHLSASQCGFEQRVRINPRNRTPVLLQMDGTSYRPGAPCTLKIDTMVEQAESYEVDVAGVGKETFPHQLIDTRDASGRVMLSFELSFR